MRELVPDLMLLFSGYPRCYGAYAPQLTDEGGGKMKGRAKTVKGDVTLELWLSHLSGEMGLGIVPIDEKNKVRFGAIDIDEYPLDLKKLNANIQKFKLPLVLCRTKSGGAHLYLFLESPHPAGDIQLKLREMVSRLGYGNAEIFPKQSALLSDRGDVGSWINMPYFNVGKTERYALDANGEELTLPNFMNYARMRLTTYEKLREIKPADDNQLPGGPPCLNHLVSLGFPQGTRNNGLFNMAIYAKKADPDNWRTMVQEYNATKMTPPLDINEVQGIIGSIEKKSFTYTCKQAPIANYCNMTRCRGCKHGIGGEASMPKFGSLSKYDSDPPIWFLDVDGGGRLQLTTEELQSPMYFQKRCMIDLNVMPGLPKRETWNEMIQELLKDVHVIEVPREVTPEGRLWILFEEFCTGRSQAKTAEELLLGKPYELNGMVYFRAADFLKFLERQNFREFRANMISMHLREWGCVAKFWNLSGKGVNTYGVPKRKLNPQTQAFTVATEIANDKF
jgi:hypothetical protein